MKINGRDIDWYNTEFLHSHLKQNRLAIKILPWVVLFCFALTIYFSYMLVTHGSEDLMAMSLFTICVMASMGILSLWSLSRTKKVNKEIVQVLKKRNITKEQWIILEEEDKRKNKETFISGALIFLLVVIISLVIMISKSCSENIEYDSEDNGVKYNSSDELYADNDHNNDGKINQKEWEDALGDRMDEIMGY